MSLKIANLSWRQRRFFELILSVRQRRGEMIALSDLMDEYAQHYAAKERDYVAVKMLAPGEAMSAG